MRIFEKPFSNSKKKIPQKKWENLSRSSSIPRNAPDLHIDRWNERNNNNKNKKRKDFRIGNKTAEKYNAKNA